MVDFFWIDPRTWGVSGKSTCACNSFTSDLTLCETDASQCMVCWGNVFPDWLSMDFAAETVCCWTVPFFSDDWDILMMDFPNIVSDTWLLSSQPPSLEACSGTVSSLGPCWGSPSCIILDIAITKALSCLTSPLWGDGNIFIKDFPTTISDIWLVVGLSICGWSPDSIL